MASFFAYRCTGLVEPDARRLSSLCPKTAMPEKTPKPPAPAGYSGTPLSKKLGIKPGASVVVEDAPPGYRDWLAPLPADVHFATSAGEGTDLVHLFCTSRTRLAERLAAYRATLAPDAVLWISWPKKSAKVPTDITEDTIRELALPLGWVDVKVCAVDATWSGLKLVVRKALR